MADETAAPAALPQDSRRETMAYVIGVAGWLVPGVGHGLLKMWGRAAACFLTVGVLVVVGAGGRGAGFFLTLDGVFYSLPDFAGLGTRTFFFAAPATGK